MDGMQDNSNYIEDADTVEEEQVEQYTAGAKDGATDQEHIDTREFEVDGHEADASSSNVVGIIYGDVGTTQFKCSVTGHLEKAEYIMVPHESCGMVLGQVTSMERKTNLSLDKAKMMAEGQAINIEERVSAMISMLGYKDERGLLQVPGTPFKAGSPVLLADDDLIRDVIGIKEDARTGAYIGMLNGHDIRIELDINSMVQKHVSVLAKTGGGKSYMTGVILEELMKHDVTVLVVDPHGEYNSMVDSGVVVPGSEKFGITPKSYAEKIIEYSPDTKINKNAKPLKFTLANMEPKDLLELTNIKNGRKELTALKKAIEALKATRSSYSLADLMKVLEAEEEGGVGGLINELEYLNSIDIFAERGTRMNELIVKGMTTILNLRGTPPDIQALIVARIATALFELRKINNIPPMLMVVEEAHNYCPQVGVMDSSKIMRTIASEGRKFGLGMVIITQRAAKVDKNVLSQCNTQVILKVTNPNDIKAIVSSVEGLSAGMADEIQRLPIGIAIVSGGGVSNPLFVQIRPRETRHGGESVKIIE